MTLQNNRIRVAYLVSHPIQYQAPMLRYITRHAPEIDLTVLFLSDFSLRGYRDAGFGETIAWDVPLLSGYRSEVLPALGKKDNQSPTTALRPISTGLSQRLHPDHFDAIWMHGYAHPTHLRVMALARTRRIPVLLRAESQAESALRPKGKLASRAKESALRLLMGQADGFLTIGTRNRDYYRSYGVPEDRLFSMPYAVDNAFFQNRAAAAAPQRATLRTSLGLEPGRPIILFASKFIPRKRAGDLLEAYCRLSPDGSEPSPYLLFVGEGEQREELQARAKQTGWNSIRFLGFRNQTELPALFDLCDVFVLVSEKEPWGLIVNEVMNAGRAVIVSDGVSAADDLVREGENGFVISVGDIDSLTDRLRRVTGEPGLAARMGAKARERIETWGFREDLEGLQAALKHVLRSAKKYPALGKVPASGKVTAGL
jgi:glycosyltransferase involved in cell wall biosynthesis